MCTREDYLTADHKCLRNSILNLVKMIPVSNDVLIEIDTILCDSIETVESSIDVIKR